MMFKRTWKSQMSLRRWREDLGRLFWELNIGKKTNNSRTLMTVTFKKIFLPSSLVLCNIYFYFSKGTKALPCERTNQGLTPWSLRSTLLLDCYCCSYFVLMCVKISFLFTGYQLVSEISDSLPGVIRLCELPLIHWWKSSDHLKWQLRVRITFYLHSLQLTPSTDSSKCPDAFCVFCCFKSSEDDTENTKNVVETFQSFSHFWSHCLLLSSSKCQHASVHVCLCGCVCVSCVCDRERKRGKRVCQCCLCFTFFFIQENTEACLGQCQHKV